MPIIAPNILLPRKDIDLTKWAVIACDQFTSEPKYWNEVAEVAKNAPSTLHITLPEIYLSKVNEEKIDEINDTINRYLSEGIFVDIGKCFVLVDRKTPYVKHRMGLMIAIDLEQYEYSVGTKAAVRATEGTILERIPPRKKVRINAPIELPHVMVLFNDKKNKIIGNLVKNIDKHEKLYDFQLNMGGGHITGYKITETAKIIKQFESLVGESGMMFAVGDGNHSLATAKSCWDTIKQNLTEEQKLTHPARFALVEAVNIYDEGLSFEPIHRVVFNATEELVDEIKAIGGENVCEIYSEGKSHKLSLPADPVEAVTKVQNIIDRYMEQNPEIKIDYIHGLKDVKNVVNENPGSVGITLPAFDKAMFFDYVEHKGAMPRKTFSMGEGVEKRYYLEAKLIK
ncbi:MAG TPA: DUF1015 domain-containing protein [Clostridia bacterium]|nr:DUF1015 domain-containing protein [Clostridia bacterium]